MFGRLPQFHRLLLTTAALVVGMAAGAWTAHVTPLALAPGVGAVAGAFVGLVVSFALVHDFSHHPRAARVPRRH